MHPPYVISFVLRFFGKYPVMDVEAQTDNDKHGVIDRAHARSILHKYRLFTVRVCMRTASSATQWLITVRLTSDQ